MTKRLGNRALVELKAASQEQTRQKLGQALDRLRDGATHVVPRGAKLNVSNVAKEAGVDRTTVHRYHKPVVEEIERLSSANSRRQLRDRRSELAKARKKTREYRELVEEAQRELQDALRVNHRLHRRNQELECILHQRDQTIAEQEGMIAELRGQLVVRSNVVSWKPRGGA